MTTAAQNHSASHEGPPFAVAGAFLEGLAAQDFNRLDDALTAGAALRALLPRGFVERTGAGVIAGQFAHWFGDTEDFELVEATVGDVAGRLHLHWRLRLRAERLGNGWFTVEQQAYADAAAGGRIARQGQAARGHRKAEQSLDACRRHWGRVPSYFFLTVRAIAPTAGASVSQSPIVTTMDVT
jgi:hypothetical protein